jgi:hypothetical protein
LTNCFPEAHDLHVDAILYRPTSQAVHSDSNVLPGKLDFPATQFVHAGSSFNTLDPYLPAVHCEHESASEKVMNGFDMKVPAGQQP